MYNGTERRKVNLMSKDSFQPSTAFEGYVKCSLDNIEKRFDCLPCKETFDRLGTLENKMSNMEGRATVLSVVFGFVAGIFSKVFIK